MRCSMAFATTALAFGLSSCMRSDAGITAKVNEQLLQARLPQSIVVSTNDGVVTLAGSVPDAATKQHAEQLALEVGGVQRIVNNLRTTVAGDAPQPNMAPPAAVPPAQPQGMPNVPAAPAQPPMGQVPSE